MKKFYVVIEEMQDVMFDQMGHEMANVVECVYQVKHNTFQSVKAFGKDSGKVKNIKKFAEFSGFADEMTEVVTEKNSVNISI